jgi:hypothetical protein
MDRVRDAWEGATTPAPRDCGQETTLDSQTSREHNLLNHTGDLNNYTEDATLQVRPA